jgi:hypothetical protein
MGQSMSDDRILNKKKTRIYYEFDYSYVQLETKNFKNKERQWPRICLFNYLQKYKNKKLKTKFIVGY